MPYVNTEAMNVHLAEISRCVSVGAIALLILDGASWHISPKLKIPDNIALLPLPPYAPELNPVENIWAFLRGNILSHRIYEDYEAVIQACADCKDLTVSLQGVKLDPVAVMASEDRVLYLCDDRGFPMNPSLAAAVEEVRARIKDHFRVKAAKEAQSVVQE